MSDRKRSLRPSRADGHPTGTLHCAESRIVFPVGAAGLFGKVGLVDLPEWVDQLWGELRFAELAAQESGDGFQRLFQRVMKAVDGESFLDIRPIGKFGDFKCDGWDAVSHTCYAVYGPFTRKTPAQVHRKIAGDLHGAVRAWPGMRNWRLVHNDQAGVSVLVAAALVSLQDNPAPTARNVEVLPPWGPKDLWWLLRQAPPDVRASVLGAQPWSLNRRQFQGLVGANDNPVSVSAGRSVAQLVHGFAEGGLVDPLAGTAFAGTLTMFLLGDEDIFHGEAALLEQRCREDPFETMLTAVMFSVLALRLWEEATGGTPEAWASGVVDCGATVPYITQIVLSARTGTDPEDPLPGHPGDQQKVTMNLGPVTAMTLLEAASHVPYPLISVLQDLIIRAQRTPGMSVLQPSDGRRSR